MNLSPGKDVENGLATFVEPDTHWETLTTGFGFTEGPAWHRDGYLVFSDILGDRLHRWDSERGLETLREPSHMANGTTWDRGGNLLICEHARSRVSRLSPGGGYQVLASHYLGKELNSPNDIIEKSDGSVWFTDPNSGRSARWGVERPQQLTFQGIFQLKPDNGEMTLLCDDFSKPNGLCFSHDESRLFVNDTDRQHIRVFDIREDGTLSGGAVFGETGGARPGVADGMKLDVHGNLYCCGSGGLHVFDPDGGKRGVLETPEVAANFTWGGPERLSLLATATTSIYRLPMKIPGFLPAGYE